jgi:hypothetical protein
MPIVGAPPVETRRILTKGFIKRARLILEA